MPNQSTAKANSGIYYKQNIDKWILHAQNKAIKKGYHSPPIDKFLRKMGYEFPPALFWSFPILMAVFGGYFATAWGTFMYFFIWKSAGFPIQFAIISSLAAGLLFGLMMAFMFHFVRRKHGLTDWDKFTKEFGVS